MTFYTPTFFTEIELSEMLLIYIVACLGAGVCVGLIGIGGTVGLHSLLDATFVFMRCIHCSNIATARRPSKDCNCKFYLCLLFWGSCCVVHVKNKKPFLFSSFFKTVANNISVPHLTWVDQRKKKDT